MSSRIELDAAATKVRIAALLEAYPELTDDEELLADALEGETDLHSLAARIVDIRQDAEAMKAGIKERKADLTERGNRMERKSDAATALLKSLMDAAGVDKLVLPEATISITASRASVEVTDLDALPSQLCKLIKQPDKTAISKRLMAGEAIPGAALVYGETGVTIRTK